MKIKVDVGSSLEDKGALHFSDWTLFGFGHEKTIAIYYPSTNALEILSGHAKILDKILSALRKYINKFSYGSLSFGREPLNVKFWC